MNFQALKDTELCALLKREDGGAWRYVLEKIVDQEKRSAANNRKRNDWNVPLEDLLGQLYEEMVGMKKLDRYTGEGSLVGWMRAYLRGYLTRRNPENSRSTPIDEDREDQEGERRGTLEEEISFRLSEDARRNAYENEGLRVLKREQWEIARKCFGNLWKGNSMQAYVLLLKTRFQMSSLEITERFGISSAANVDQLFSRAVKRMKEEKVKYGG